MTWFQTLIQKIQVSDNTKYINKINDLKKRNDLLHNENNKLTADIINLRELNDEVEKDNDALIKANQGLISERIPEKTTHDTYFRKTIQSYTWKPKKTIRLHESLERFSDNLDMIDKYNKWLNTLGIKNYNDPDKIIYTVTLQVQKYINSLPDDYKTDTEAFGISEYWLSPSEAFDRYVMKKKVSDCEDVSALLYGAIISKLIVNQLFYEIWRLKRIDVKITGSGGHALLAWKKNNNVWAAIESTYGEEYFKSNWNRDADVFKSIYVRILHIFDERGEYLLK